MKSILSFIILVLGLCCSMQAQTNSLTKLDSLPTAKGKLAANGLKTGRWVYYQSNGLKASEGKYLPVIVKDSAWVIDPATYMEVLDTFYQEQRIGKWKYYYEDGKILMLTIYSKRKGKKSLTYYSKFGVNFQDRWKNGHYSVRKSYHENGNLDWVAHYGIGNKMNGRFRKWNEEGKPVEKGRYRNGEKVGMWKSWKGKSGVCKVKYPR